MLLPKTDALLGYCHIQTMLSHSARPMSLFIKNWAAIWSSYGIHPILVGPQELSATGGCGINLVGFFLKTERFWDLLAPGASNT